MKIRNFIFIFIALTSTIISCKKDAEVCSLSAASLNGKSLKVSKVILVKLGVKTDMTALFLAQSPCSNATIQFTETTIKPLFPSNCTMSAEDLAAASIALNYKLTTENGKNYINVNPPGEEAKKTEVTAFDCSSLTMAETYERDTIEITYTAL